MPIWWREYPERDNEYVCYYPPDIGPLSWAEVWSDSQKSQRTHVGMYIHIPFCVKECPFCNYNHVVAKPRLVKEYVDALCREIYLYGGMQGVGSLPVPFIYFGGGTPTVLSVSQFSAIFDAINQHFILDGAEISIEAHPVTVDVASLASLRQLGVNRISFGVQSFQPEFLSRIGAYHTVEQARAAISMAREAGFDNLAIDLMFALPGQSAADWEIELHEAIAVHPEHISCYRMMVDPAGSLGKRIRKGQADPQPRAEEDVKMAIESLLFLPKANYRHYRSQASLALDFALPGKESRYEIMHDGAPQSEYLPLGVGAFGYVNGYMYCNIHTITEYLEEVGAGHLPVLAGRRMSLTDEMSRFMVLGIKQLSVAKAAFQDRFSRKLEEVFPRALDQLSTWGLIEVTDATISVTAKGILYMDNISKAFYGEADYRVPQPYKVQLQYWSKQFFG